MMATKASATLLTAADVWLLKPGIQLSVTEIFLLSEATVPSCSPMSSHLAGLPR
jgi:hypothetical protein